MRMRGRRLHMRGFLLSVPYPFCRSPCGSETVKSVIEFGVLYWKMLKGGGIYRGRGIGGGSQNKSSSHYFLNQLNVSNKWSAYFTVIVNPTYPSYLSACPPTTAIRRKATLTHTFIGWVLYICVVRRANVCKEYTPLWIYDFRELS